MVRFVSLEIFATGVLKRECSFSSRTFSLVQSRRFARLVFVAIWVLSYEGAMYHDNVRNTNTLYPPPLMIVANYAHV
jgi:hypothetical protein